MSQSFTTRRQRKRVTPRERIDARRTLLSTENNNVHIVQVINPSPITIMTLPCSGEIVLKYQAETDKLISPIRK